jgi:hypothetical protein
VVAQTQSNANESKEVLRRKISEAQSKKFSLN